MASIRASSDGPANREMPPDDASPAAYLATAERYVDEMFAGTESRLATVYDALLTAGTVNRPGHQSVSLQNDCSDLPPSRDRADQTRRRRRASTSVWRSANAKAPKRLIDTGGFMKKDRITHRIESQMAVDDIDDELKRWLKKAYELDA